MSATSQLRADSVHWIESLQATPAIFRPLCDAPLCEVYGDGVAIDHYSATMLLRRPASRHVVAYKLQVRNLHTGRCMALDLIGKRDTSRAVGKAAREFQAMQSLWAAGFGHNGNFIVPRPIHLSMDKSLILQERAGGTVLSALAAEGGAACFEGAKAAGGWLARLHCLPIAPAGVCAYAGYMGAVQFHVREIVAAQPALKEELEVLAARIHRELSSFQPVPFSVVHGDYHAEHIYIDDKNVTVIDYDRLHFGDPAQDLGSFIGHAYTSARTADNPTQRPSQNVLSFLTGYCNAVSCKNVAALKQRVSTFVALACLEALYYVAAVLKMQDAKKINAYLRCAQEASTLVSPMADTVGSEENPAGLEEAA